MAEAGGAAPQHPSLGEGRNTRGLTGSKQRENNWCYKTQHNPTIPLQHTLLVEHNGDVFCVQIVVTFAIQHTPHTLTASG